MHKDMVIAKDQNPPLGYPTAEEASEQHRQDNNKTKQKGDRGFIEGCFFALCCCWICEMCF